MALEAVVFQQDPFIYGVGFQQQQEQKANYCNTEEMLAKSGGFGFGATWGTSLFSPTDPSPVDVRSCRPRRRRVKVVKNRQEIENQRMTHIAVERNRRRQMNDYLAQIRSMMPNSYAQRGDQASIIGGAINFVKELEHFLQSLEARKSMAKTPDNSNPFSSLFSDFFSFPQYSTGSNGTHLSYAVAENGSSSPSPSVADVEVTMVDRHANVKIRSKKHPKQLFSMVSGIHSLGLLVLHLNATSVENMALYSFSVKIEENCQLTTVNEVAAAVYELLDRFQEEATA
ncbi:Transcription factor bHLH99 [Hibiscus syriacus]|uniref:Transcription factor bHLH99 n=1 Tax=Hibiscus syriacus TaxID=106335 RepID=A0A6A3BIE9_HIBSY|nr:transcription factor bHLH96-like [Hibiscus syriacus]KAE8715807.1 Transcription factor bHLH99 [Hibiscus syriacus]